MNHSFFAILVCLTTWIAASDLIAQHVGQDARQQASDDSEEVELQTTIFSTGVHDPRSVAVAALQVFSDDVEMSITPLTEQRMLIVRAPEKHRDEIMQVLKTLTPQEQVLRVRVMLLEAAAPISDQALERFNGPTLEVISAIEQCKNEKSIQLVNDLEQTLIPNQPSRIQVGEQVNLQMGKMQIGPGRTATQSKQYEIGTALSILTSIDGKEIAVELEFTKSFLRSTSHSEDSDVTPASIATLTHQSTHRLTDGHAELVGRLTDRSSEQRTTTQLLIVAVKKL
jgi:hypothetical protein